MKSLSTLSRIGMRYRDSLAPSKEASSSTSPQPRGGPCPSVAWQDLPRGPARRSVFGGAASLAIVAFLTCYATASSFDLTWDDYDHVSPRWSPNGGWIVCEKTDATGYRQIYKIAVGLPAEGPLTSDAYHHTDPSFSPDGNWIVYHKEDAGGYTQIYKVALVGGAEMALTNARHQHNYPDWSPDGAWIVFSTGTQIYRVGAQGGAEEALTSTDGSREFPRYSPDGNSVVYCFDPNGANNYAIAKVSSSGGTETVLTSSTTCWEPRWSPDGSWICYQMWNQSYQIAKVGSTGGNEVVLATGGDSQRKSPEWSPDGSWIAYTKDSAPNTSNIFKVSSSGGTEIPVTSGDLSIYTPEWSPDGNWIAMSRRDCPSTSPAGFRQIALCNNWNTVGWTLSEDSTIPSAGLLLYGDNVMKEMAGIGASTAGAKSHVLAHFHSSSKWYTGVAVANLSQTTPANVTATARDAAGTILKTVSLSIPKNGKFSKLVSDSSFLGITNSPGWIELTSDQDVVAFDLYGDMTSGGIAALPSSATNATIIIPYFNSKSPWYTGIAVANPNNSAVDATLVAYSSAGTALGSTTVPLPAKGKVSKMIESFISAAASQTGWVEVKAGSPIAAIALYGDTSVTPNRIAAVSGMTGSTQITFSDMRYSSPTWQTSLWVVNPDASNTAALVLKVRRTDGALLGALTRSLKPHERYGGNVNTLFGLSASVNGYSYAYTSDGRPIVGQQFISANDDANQYWGLCAIEGQSMGTVLCFPHYDVGSRWWTQYSFANPDWSNTGIILDPLIAAYGNDGTVAGINEAVLIRSKRSMETGVKELFGM